MKKKLVAIIVAVLIVGALGLTACTTSTDNGPVAENNTATAYGVLHKQYAGRVSVTVGDDKNIQDVRFEEFLPMHELGVVSSFVNVKATTVEGTTTYAPETVAIDAAHKVEVVTGISKNSTTGAVSASKKTFAKFIKIGGKMFELKEVIAADTATATAISYPFYAYTNADWTNDTTWILPVSGTKVSNQTDTSADTTTEKSNTEVHVVHSMKWPTSTTVKLAYENPEFTKFYIENMEKGDYYICKSATAATTADYYDIRFEAYGTTRVTKGSWANKNVNGYWTRTSSQSGLGWRTNIEAMRSFLIGKTFEGYLGTEVKGTNGTFKFGSGTVETGATLTDYHEYMKLAKTAYEKSIELFA